MRTVPIVMPQLGESIAEATVVQWLVKPGDPVRADQDLMEVETTKATTTVTASSPGTVGSLSAKSGETYPVGATLGILMVQGEEPAQDRDADSNAPEPVASIKTETLGAVDPTVKGLPVPASVAGASYMSPRMKARMNELGLHAADLAGIAGSGAGGRVTTQDLEKFLAGLSSHKLTQASTMRVAVADAMRRSWTRPLATVALPLNLDPILNHRRCQQVKAGPALYVLRALALALAEDSAPAGRLVGNKIVHPPAIDIGFAVEVPDGVLVPVLRRVDQMRLAELLPRYMELVELARARRLPNDATGGSVATVTNFGTFGLTWATPIPLPEQTLVLGLGAGRKVPFWNEAEGKFSPVTEANVTLSFDHRVLDGGGAGRLLGRLASLLQAPELL